MDKKNQNFSEKHPRLSMLMGLIILMAMLGVLVLFIRWIFDIIINGIELTLKTVSNLDGVVIVALITGCISLVSVIISSIVGKFVEFKTNRVQYLTQKREDAYAEFINVIYKLNISVKKQEKYPEDEMINDINKFSSKLTLWGSKSVVKKWVKFREICNNPNENKDNLKLAEEIMNEMRKDLGTKKVKQGNLLSFFINDIKNLK